MKPSEIAELSDKEIRERIQVEQDNLTRLRMNHAVSPIDNPMKLKVARRNIARLKSIMHQRQLTKNQE